jgi:hypothetical protein
MADTVLFQVDKNIIFFDARTFPIVAVLITKKVVTHRDLK